MATNGGVNLSDGVLLEQADVTTVELLPDQAALIMYPDGVTLALPNKGNEEGTVPQHVMFLIGIYFMSEDAAFVEKAIRFGIDRLASVKDHLPDDE